MASYFDQFNGGDAFDLELFTAMQTSGSPENPIDVCSDDEENSTAANASTPTHEATPTTSSSSTTTSTSTTATTASSTTASSTTASNPTPNTKRRVHSGDEDSDPAYEPRVWKASRTARKSHNISRAQLHRVLAEKDAAIAALHAKMDEMANSAECIVCRGLDAKVWFCKGCQGLVCPPCLGKLSFGNHEFKRCPHCRQDSQGFAQARHARVMAGHARKCNDCDFVVGPAGTFADHMFSCANSPCNFQIVDCMKDTHECEYEPCINKPFCHDVGRHNCVFDAPMAEILILRTEKKKLLDAHQTLQLAILHANIKDQELLELAGVDPLST